MRQDEPPSRSKPLLFMIGRDSRGYWVVQDQHHLRGGLFINRAEALRFAMFENGNRPEAAIMMPGVIELDFNLEQDAGAVSTPDGLQRAA